MTPVRNQEIAMARKIYQPDTLDDYLRNRAGAERHAATMKMHRNY
jgi:hypothetical protein